ncbi:MAG: microcystin LR degradation protein MlrC-like protein [Alcaligenaceae bacterium]|nr:MAG: microcystin LR degradation protein MlrC-like protein [Alcaligenaceae bacterium]
MRVFFAALGTETNTFSPLPTSLASFKDRDYYPAGTHPDKPTFLSGPLHVLRERCAELGWELAQGLIAAAQPSGITTRVAYETLRDELLSDLIKAMPVDMVILGMHGAMVAEGYDDCEGDILERVRACVGSGVVVGAELDLHAHLSAQMVKQADMLVLYKEYPHTDILARAAELIELCIEKYQNKIQPVAALVDCQMIVPIHTTREPGASLVKRLQSFEGKNGILSVSVAHGFATGDVPEMGTKVLVYSDAEPAAAQALARQLADELIALREALMVPYRSIDQALDEALVAPQGPVVLADRADNPGSGAPGDATFVLQRLLERQIQQAALGPLWDPVAARIAFDAGVGSTLKLRLGGKIGPLSGAPIDVLCTVKALKREMSMTSLSGGLTPLGDCALVQAQGIEIVLTSNRNQAMNIDLFTQLGCDLMQKKMVIVKSAQHFYASFSTIAKQVIYVGGQGVATPDWKTLTYTKIRRPKWPLDA